MFLFHFCLLLSLHPSINQSYRYFLVACYVRYVCLKFLFFRFAHFILFLTYILFLFSIPLLFNMTSYHMCFIYSYQKYKSRRLLSFSNSIKINERVHRQHKHNSIDWAPFQRKKYQREIYPRCRESNYELRKKVKVSLNNHARCQFFTYIICYLISRSTNKFEVLEISIFLFFWSN